MRVGVRAGGLEFVREDVGVQDRGREGGPVCSGEVGVRVWGYGRRVRGDGSRK